MAVDEITRNQGNPTLHGCGDSSNRKHKPKEPRRAIPLRSWALETAANLYSKAFAAARITGERTEKITPGVMALIARNLIRRGDSLHLIEMRRGGLNFSRLVRGTCAAGGMKRHGSTGPTSSGRPGTSRGLFRAAAFCISDTRLIRPARGLESARSGGR